jgi:hypothetical protein
MGLSSHSVQWRLVAHLTAMEHRQLAQMRAVRAVQAPPESVTA